MDTTTDLKGLRAGLGLTQAELASALGVSQGALAAWEAGLAWPTIDRLPAVADAYGISISTLVFLLIAARDARR